MKNHISRRDFLKLAGVLPATVATPGLIDSFSSLTTTCEGAKRAHRGDDAFSAFNIPLYGI